MLLNFRRYLVHFDGPHGYSQAHVWALSSARVPHMCPHHWGNVVSWELDESCC